MFMCTRLLITGFGDFLSKYSSSGLLMTRTKIDLVKIDFICVILFDLQTDDVDESDSFPNLSTNQNISTPIAVIVFESSCFVSAFAVFRLFFFFCFLTVGGGILDSFQEQCDEYSPTKSLEVAVNQCLDSTRELRVQLIATCKEQSHDLPLIIRTGYDLVTFVQTTASDGDVDSLNKYGDQFVEVVEQIGEVRIIRRVTRVPRELNQYFRCCHGLGARRAL